MIEVKVRGLDPIQTYEEMSVEQFRAWSKEVLYILDEIEKMGVVKNCCVKIESSIEPYEDSPGPVEVSIWGFREETKEEKEEQKREEKISGLAKSLGIAPYEATILLNLQERGKIKGDLI